MKRFLPFFLLSVILFSSFNTVSAEEYPAQSMLTAYPEKVAQNVIDYMESLPTDEIVTVWIFLSSPSTEEIEAIVRERVSEGFAPQEYYEARLKVVASIINEIIDPFVNNYLDDSCRILYKGRFAAMLAIEAPKTTILELEENDLIDDISLYNDADIWQDNDTNVTNLNQAIYIAEAISLGEDKDFTNDSLIVLKLALDAAKTVRDDPDTTQAEIDKAASDLTAAIDALEVIPNDPSEPFRFDDVKDDKAFYFTPVYWAVDKKITKGTSEKLFSPDAGCTRGQVVTFLWRAAGEPEPTKAENPFKDVKETDYFYKAVLWAVEKGITKGTSADKFSPEKTCTRAQIVTFLYRAEGTPEIARKSKPFHDVDEGQYYADAVAWAVENGVTTGKSADTFAPNATCTRGEIVTFLYRAAD